MTALDPALAARARRLGVATSYVDVGKVTRRASPAALRAVCDLLSAGAGRMPASDPDAGRGPIDEVVLVRGGRVVAGLAKRFGRPLPAEVTLDEGTTVASDPIASAADLERCLRRAEVPIGIHRLDWSTGGSNGPGGGGDDGRGSATLLVAPHRFPGAGLSRPAGAGRSTATRPGLALFAPAYSLWTDDEPLPSYRGLVALGRSVAGLGVGTVATLPLYAPGLGDRFQPSPYSPVSRFHWNELLLPDAVLDRPGERAPERVAASIDRRAASIDWPIVEATRRAQLEQRVNDLSPAERAELDTFLVGRPDVVSYARFCADGDDRRRRVHEVGQWLAERTLASVTDDLTTAGIRLALDLPVGARAGSWEATSNPTLFTAGASVGAPPDAFFTEGQFWDLPPLSPTASRRDGHRVWYELLHRACRYAGVLRIDHVMQVHRLWWIPDGHPATDGVYVHYPADELLAVAVIVAHRTGTVMVGEDLGTVPPEVEQRLEDWGMPGMHDEVFTLHRHVGSGPGKRPPAAREDRARSLEPVAAGTWAGIRTHDMPALAQLVADHDVGPYCRLLAAERGRPVGTDGRSVLEAMTERLRSSRALTVVIDVDDALGVMAAHNVPGTVADTNWSRRIEVPADRLGRDPRLADLVADSPSAG